MKFFILSALLTLAHTFLYSQQIKYDIIQDKNINISNNIISSTENGLLVYKESIANKLKVPGTEIGIFPGNRRGFKITKLNEELVVENSMELFDGEKKFLVSGSEIINFQNHYGIIYQEMIDGDKLGDIKFLEINESDLSVKREIVLMDFKKNGISFAAKKVLKGDVSTFKVYISQNKKRLMISSKSEYKKGEDEYVHINVLDEDFKLVQYQKIVVPVEEIYYAAICDDSGNIYGTFKDVWYEDRNVKNGDIDNKPLKIKVFKIGTHKPVTFLINHEEHSFYFNELLFSPIQNTVYVVGAYSEGRYDNFKGVYHASIDLSTMAATKMVQTPFSEELIKKYARAGLATTKKNNPGLLRFYFNPKYLIRGDGTIDFVLFYNSNEPSVSNPSPVSKVAAINYAGNILDAHIVDDKAILTTISRDMSSGNGLTYNDFSLYSNNENLVVIYNDNKDNVSRIGDEEAKKGSIIRSEILAATINKNGTVSKQLLLNGLQGKSIGLLKHLYPMPNNSFLVLMERLNGLKVGTNDIIYARVTIE